MDRLYNGCSCSECKGEIQAKEEKFFSDKEIEEILSRIYSGELNPTEDIEETLFEITLNKLNEAVDLSFSLIYEANKDFINELKYNNEVFAAFKTHKQQNDLAALLVDEDGELRSFVKFREATKPIINRYNVDWLQTEYITAVKSARTAERFRRFERDKDLYPNVRWVPSVAVEPRVSHMAYYNQIRSLSDRWWLTHYPGCVWRCQCDIENTNLAITHKGNRIATAEEKRKSIQSEVKEQQAAPGLEYNPAFTGSIFSKNHPYIKDAYPGARKAVANFIRERGGDNG